MQIATAVTTAPRKGKQWLGRCLDSLHAAGFTNPARVFAEPNTPIPENCNTKCRWHKAKNKQGPWRNYVRAIADTLQYEPDAQGILIVQDDTIFCRGVRRWLNRNLWPSESCGFVSLYTSAGYDGQITQGLHRLDDRWLNDFWGACAIIFPRHVAEALVRYAAKVGWQGHPHRTIKAVEEKKHVDTFVGRFALSQKLEGWLHNPSLASHVGSNSTLGHNGSTGKRAPLRFPGEEADATEVLSPRRK